MQKNTTFALLLSLPSLVAHSMGLHVSLNDYDTLQLVIGVRKYYILIPEKSPVLKLNQSSCWIVSAPVASKEEM